MGSTNRCIVDPGATKNICEEISRKLAFDGIDEQILKAISRLCIGINCFYHKISTFCAYFMVGALGFEPRASTSRTWRAARLRYAPIAVRPFDFAQGSAHLFQTPHRFLKRAGFSSQYGLCRFAPETIFELKLT